MKEKTSSMWGGNDVVEKTIAMGGTEFARGSTFQAPNDV